MFYPLKRLSDLKANPDDFFSNVYMSNAHDNSIELVRRGIVDAASVNSLIYEYTKSVYPEKVSNIKIIEKSEPFGMPPIVVSKNINPALRDSLYNILTNMNHDPEGNQILRGLMIDKYIQTSDDEYNSIRKMCTQIGYPTSIANGNNKSLSHK
jgi:phosphonate transport system substrate-binding protein